VRCGAWIPIVEVVGFAPTRVDDLVESPERLRHRARRQAHHHAERRARLDDRLRMRRRLASARTVDARRQPADHGVVESVFDE
jgi:hypothetical protein